MNTQAAKNTQTWTDEKEKGSPWLLRFTLFMVRLLGRKMLRPLVWMVAWYYVFISPSARTSIREFREHLNLPTRKRDVHQHIFTFAQSTIDGLLFMMGKTEDIEVSHVAHHELKTLVDNGKGGILLGAHVGNLYALQRRSADRNIPIRPVVYYKNAKVFNALAKELNPQIAERIIEIGDDNMQAILKLRDAVENGDLVAIMGDRIVDEKSKTVEVDFLGEKANLPAGPYLIAHTLRCPVLFVAGTLEKGNHYSLDAKKLSDRLHLPRGKREEAVAEYAQHYANWLASLARKHPTNWFNFFPFWTKK